MEEKNTNVMDVATTEMTEKEEKNIENLAEAKAAALGTNVTPNFFFRKPRQVVRDYTKVHRNDPCPCGSGKKYKNCCLSSGKYSGTHEL